MNFRWPGLTSVPASRKERFCTVTCAGARASRSGPGFFVTVCAPAGAAEETATTISAAKEATPKILERMKSSHWRQPSHTLAGTTLRPQVMAKFCFAWDAKQLHVTAGPGAGADFSPDSRLGQRSSRSGRRVAFRDAGPLTPSPRGGEGGLRGVERCDTALPYPPHPTLSPSGRGSEAPRPTQSGIRFPT